MKKFKVLAEQDRHDAIRALAEDQRAEACEVEIDFDAIVSEGDGNGAFVAAWVWVDYSGTDLDKDCDPDPEEPEDMPQDQAIDLVTAAVEYYISIRGDDDPENAKEHVELRHALRSL